MAKGGFLVVLTGPTASGKSTIAEWLQQQFDNTEAFHSAELRRELGLTPEEMDYEFDLSDETFVGSVSEKVYDEMRTRAKKVLDHGGIAVLDGSHRLRKQRLASYRIGLDRNLPTVLIVCECDDTEVIRERLTKRQKRKDPLAEATAFSTYLSTKEEAESVGEDPPIEQKQVGVLKYNSKENQVTVEQHCPEASVTETVTEELRALIHDKQRD